MIVPRHWKRNHHAATSHVAIMLIYFTLRYKAYFCAPSPILYRITIHGIAVPSVTAANRLFLRSKILTPLYQSAIDLLSETLLWFGIRGVAGMQIRPNCQLEEESALYSELV